MKAETRAVTIADVARHVGVAKGTVSRVLNNYSDISEATRQQVLKAIEELGYRPSSLARNLKRGRVDTVGMVLPIAGANATNPFLSEFLNGISYAFSKLDKDLLVSTAATAEDALAAYGRMLAARKVDGIIITRTLYEDPRVDYLLERGVPFVTHGRDSRCSEHAWFDVDNEGAMHQAVAHAVELGHRRIGFIGGSLKWNFARQRDEGYRAGLEDCGLVFDPELTCTSELSEQGGEDAAKALLMQEAPPTALLCMTDELGIGAINCARKLGLEVGADLTVIGYDALPVGAHLDTPLTTFAQHMEDAGKNIARSLDAILRGDDPQSHQMLVPAAMVRRNSDGPPRLSSQDLAGKIRKAF